MGFVLRSSLPWMSAKAMKAVSEGHKGILGQGATSVVRLVPYKNKLACMKVGRQTWMIPRLIDEALVLRHLNGAGGAPRLLGICKEEPKLLMTYSGRSTAFSGWWQTNPFFWIRAFQYLFQQLWEIHEKGICHNDIHWGNIIVQNTLDGADLDVKLIDFGLTEPLFDQHTMAQVQPIDPPPASDMFMAGRLMKTTIRQLEWRGVIQEGDWPKGMLELRDNLLHVTNKKHTAVEVLEHVESIKSELDPTAMGFYDWTKPNESVRQIPDHFIVPTTPSLERQMPLRPSAVRTSLQWAKILNKGLK